MRRALIALASVLALPACGDSPIMIMDTGPRDTGTVGTDAPTTPTDAPTTPTCPPASAPAPDPDQCDAATLTCLMTATTQAAQMACIEADSTGDACIACLNQEAFATCTTGTATCDDEFGLLACCLEEACPTGDAACLQAASGAGGDCAAETMDMITCVNTEVMARRCGNSAELCFREASGFLPDFRDRSFAWRVTAVRWSGVFAD